MLTANMATVTEVVHECYGDKSCVLTKLGMGVAFLQGSTPLSQQPVVTDAYNTSECASCTASP